MEPTGPNPTERYNGASYSSSSLAHPVGSIVTPSYLESPSVNMTPFSDVTPVSSLPEIPTPTPDRFSVFRLNHTALLVTTLVISFIVLIGLSSFAFNKLTTKQSATTPQSSNSPISQYSVGDLPLQQLNPTTTELQLGTADKLAINGQLLLNSTLVLSPTTVPSTPITGQFYYDKTTNQPYFYNGSQFISLQPTTQASSTTTSSSTATSPQSTITTTVTSLGGSTGAITLGSGLTMTANQLDIAGALLTGLNASNITSGTVADARLSANVNLQGNTFNGASQLVQLNALSQLPAISGANLIDLNGSSIVSGTVVDARLSTNVTLQGNLFNGVSQLVQTTPGGVLPVISGANLTALNATNITAGTVADSRLSTNVTVQGNTFNGASQLLQLTAGGILPTLSGANLTALNGTNVTSGTVVDARLSNNVTLQGNTFNGVSQLVQTTAGGILPVISGSNLTSINGSNITIGTVDDTRLSVNVAFLNNVARQFFLGNIAIGTASSSTTSTLFVNGVIESWGGLKMPANASAPFTCIPAASGTISLTLFFVTCVCNGSSWVFTNDGSTSCNWLPVPLIPTIGTASDTPTGRPYNNGLATVYFTPSATGPTATSFTVTSSPGSFTGTGTSSPITVAGLQTGVLYTFTVTATNANGTSNPSAASNAVTINTTPQPPTIGTAIAYYSSATVAYTDNANGGSAITGHTAISSPGSFTGTGASPITISGLTNGTAYTLAVSATNVYGTSAYSTASNPVTPVAKYSAAYYSCPSGGSLSDSTNCTIFGSYLGTGGGGSYYTAAAGYYCGTGGWDGSQDSATGTTCNTLYNYPAIYNAAYYSCPSGGYLSGTTTCYYNSASYAATSNAAYYSCPSGGTLDGVNFACNNAVKRTYAATYYSPQSPSYFFSPTCSSGSYYYMGQTCYTKSTYAATYVAPYYY